MTATRFKLDVEAYIQKMPKSSPRVVYDSLLNDKILEHDPKQLVSIQAFERLYRKLNGYKVKKRKTASIFSSVFGDTSTTVSKKPRRQGLYVFGNVGTGKTMLMDLFFHCVNVEKKERIHFNAFMLDVHSSSQVPICSYDISLPLFLKELFYSFQLNNFKAHVFCIFTINIFFSCTIIKHQEMSTKSCILSILKQITPIVYVLIFY